MDIRMIGMGAMSAAMAPHLVKAGHAVGAWNRSPGKVEQLAGVQVLASPVAAFDADVVLTMLADDAALRSAIIDSNALANARPGCVHVVMSTISPALADELARLHREHGVKYVAAPVFGVPATAAEARLQILAAGEPEAVQAATPVLELLGQKIWRLGDQPNHANIAKIAGNLMIMQAIEAIGEAAALVESHGVAAADFLDIMTNTVFATPSYRRYADKIARQSYEPGFKLVLGYKDVNLALAAAATQQVDLPGAQVVRARMAQALEAGLAEEDWSAFSRMTRRPMHIEAGAHKFHVRIDGPQDAPPLLLIHALGANMHIWDAQAQALSARFRVIRFDLPGHGLSEPGPWHIEQLAGEVFQLLDALRIDSAHIAGVSVGGMIAQAAAATQPARVRSLILCGTLPRFPDEVRALWAQRAVQVRAEGMAPLVESVVGRWVTVPFNASPQAQALRAILHRASPQSYASGADSIAVCDLRALTATIRVKTLVLVGDGDLGTPHEAVKAMADTIEGAQFSVIEGTAHIPMVEQPQAVLSAMQGFLP